MRAAFSLAVALLLLAGCGYTERDESHKINGSVHIIAGKAPVEAKTVNGGIDIDADANVTAAKTVNGGVHLGAHATASSLTTVNGPITLDAGARATGTVESVNGGLTLREGSEVGGPLENVNGKIELNSAHVNGGIKTVNGSIDITGNSRVERGILVQKAATDVVSFGNEPPRIVIGPGTTVEGELRFERVVQLYVSDRATIGPVVGATAIRFSGDAPPG
jgi:DUF4097 and DUF4098 domain-containing protein YvlB